MSSVTIQYHQENDGWWAESDSIPGWTAAGATFAEARTQALSAVREFLGGSQNIREDGVPPDAAMAEEG
jgi:predicted RNase H-like HicB family nuclease